MPTIQNELTRTRLGEHARKARRNTCRVKQKLETRIQAELRKQKMQIEGYKDTTFLSIKDI